MADIKKLTGRIPPSIRRAAPYDAQRPPCRIRLDGNESPFSLPPEPAGSVLAGVSKVPLNRYPDPDCAEIKEMISESEGVPPDGIVPGNGSDELIQTVIQTFCGGSGAVLVPSPTFSMYALTASVLGKKVVRQKLDGNFDLDEGAMLQVIGEADPDVIFLASPNSPTGNLLSPEKIEAVISAAPGIVVVDEAYFHFCGATCLPLMEKYPNLAVLRTFSKIGFAGLRLGVLFMQPALAAEASKARLPYNINSLTQAAVKVFFENVPMFEENAKKIVRERELMSANLRSINGITVFPSDANFLLVRFPSVRAANAVWQSLVEKGILTRNFSGGEVSDCLRVTVGLAEENREFESALKEITVKIVR